MASTEAQLMEHIDKFMKTDSLEEAFLSILVYNDEDEERMIGKFTEDYIKDFSSLLHDNRENAVRQLLQRAATSHNMRGMSALMCTMEKLFEEHHITAKLMCEKILACDKLIIDNQQFWIECFKLVKKAISHVDYKGVREIMKACRDKMNLFPVNINVAYLPQLSILESIIRMIFNRDNCLLPAYFIVNEVMKPVPSHWKLNKLITNLIDEFRYTAQMVTIIGQPYMVPIVEHFGYADHMMNSWKIDHTTLKFQFKSSLPYEPEMLEEQTSLLRHILHQPYSREMVSVIMNLQKQQKQRCNALEEQLVNLIIAAMEITEEEETSDSNGFNVTEDRISENEWMWLHLSSQLIYFVLFQFISFMHIVLALYEKLTEKDLRKGRNQLMWILLQFISGSIQKNPIANFLPMFKLFDLLYPEDEPLKLPDYNKSSCLRKMAPICTWVHIMKKARVENMNISRPLPIALKSHYEFLQHMVMPTTMMSYSSLGNDFRIILVCNAYSTNQEYFARPMNILVEALNTNTKGANGQPMPAAPFSMVVLDSLTVHSKMSLIHNFVTQMVKQAQSKSLVPSPALVETYARLLVYTEIESLGVKGFLVQLLPQVCKSHAWGILNVLLEMFSYRLHHIPTHYRVQFLSHLHSLVSVPQINKMQLNLCFESTALRLISDLGSTEVQPQLSRYFNEKSPASVASTESEELNRVLILTLARSMNITGAGEELQPWCRELLTNIMQNTPHTWASQTLACFPPALNEFFLQNSPAVENRQLLKKAVEEEYRNWTSMSNENDIIAHFIRSNANTLFLCVLFKMIWETDTITPVAYKILEGISTRALSAHLRKLCDYLVGEVSTCNSQDFIHKCVDTINHMLWKYNVITIDRVVLCLALRMQEGNEAQVCFLVIQLLLLKTPEMRTRVQEFCKENNQDHWLQSNWHEKHLAYHQMFPEKFASDESASQPPLPVFFSNVCLRFLPVLDIVLHRFIELPIQPVHQILEVILDQLSILYKFHYRPITYLYSTFHFYEYIFRDRPPLKKKLVGSILNAFNEIRPVDWCLSEQYREYLQSPDVLWNPDLKYYLELLRRLTDSIEGNKVIYNTDWRFNEFPNAPAHALYATCVEILALPLAPSIVASNFVDVIFEGYWVIGEEHMQKFINSFGAIFAALPFAYWNGIADRMQELLNSPQMMEWNYRFTAYEMFNFKTVTAGMIDKNFAFILAIVHSIMHHMGCFKLATMITILKEKLSPCVHNEDQFVFLCHVFGAFLQRIELEKPNAVASIAILLYEMLEVVDKQHGPGPLKYMDPICDFLYHIKYIHVGNIIKNESESVIKRLRPALQMRLRFIAYHNVEEVQSGSEDTTQTQQNETIVQSLKQQSQISMALQMQQQQQQQILLQQQLPPNPLVLAAMVGGPSLPLPPPPTPTSAQPKRQQKDQPQAMNPPPPPQQPQLSQQQQLQQQMQMHQQQQHHMQMHQQQHHQMQQFQLQQQHMQHLQQQQLQMQQQQQQQQNMNMRHN